MDTEGTLKALVLDDEADARFIISNILNKNGYDIVQVDTIQSASNELAKNSFDLLFLDYNLPDGNSYDLLSDDLVKKSPTIICSAYLNSEQISKFMELGVKVCLHKPLNQNRIVDEITKIKNKTDENTGN